MFAVNKRFSGLLFYAAIMRFCLPAATVQVRKLPTCRLKQPSVRTTGGSLLVLRSDRIQGQAEDFADMIVERTQQNPQVNSVYKIIQHDRTLCRDRP
ncbi:hypothetical protein [Paenibacillus illinoisensis]|uniref:hypothetical protein n=1 Tax=Paenibacillus illinoisensis TaxID=59845 RepID=UPI003D9610AF